MDKNKTDLDPMLLHHRQVFGRAITAWLTSNGWSQQTPHRWAQAVSARGPWGSQMSPLTRGTLEPKAQLWASLAQFNQAIAIGAFKSVTDRRLRDQLSKGTPFLTAKGTPATATDMFSMFIGEAPIPSVYLAPAVDPAVTEIYELTQNLDPELIKQLKDMLD